MGTIETSLNYSEEASEKPAFYLFRPLPEVSRRGPQPVLHTMQIHDARALEPAPSLDREGFALARQESAVSDFYDPDEVRAAYFPEVERLVAEATGASRVLAFDHNVRDASRASRSEDGAQTPVRFVHNDYTERSGPQRVRDLVEPDEADALLAKRFAVINVWRPITGPVQTSPFAFCDARSIAPRDLMPIDLVYRDRTGEVYAAAYNPDHHWCYYPNMQKHEVVLLKCYDSAHDGRARFTVHSAFEDPGTPRDAPARESIEVRTLGFFD